MSQQLGMTIPAAPASSGLYTLSSSNAYSALNAPLPIQVMRPSAWTMAKRMMAQDLPTIRGWAYRNHAVQVQKWRDPKIPTTYRVFNYVTGEHYVYDEKGRPILHQIQGQPWRKIPKDIWVEA